MKAEYDFSKARRGAVVPSAPGKARITIRLDCDVIEWFKTQVNARMIPAVTNDIHGSGHWNNLNFFFEQGNFKWVIKLQ